MLRNPLRMPEIDPEIPPFLKVHPIHALRIRCIIIITEALADAAVWHMQARGNDWKSHALPRFGAHQHPSYLSLAFFQVLKSYSEKSAIEKLLEANACAGLTTMIAVGFTAWRHILSF